MILALATRHRVERPAISMGGGTKNPMERLARRRLDTPLKNYREIENPHYIKVRILSFFKSHRETRMIGEKHESKGRKNIPARDYFT